VTLAAFISSVSKRSFGFAMSSIFDSLGNCTTDEYEPAALAIALVSISNQDSDIRTGMTGMTFDLSIDSNSLKRSFRVRVSESRWTKINMHRICNCLEIP